ncbi:hypothetical protein Q8A73_020594 [Channa argus]|nr:hypothetical protein Q8A73_020594 [Channa argus]
MHDLPADKVSKVRPQTDLQPGLDVTTPSAAACDALNCSTTELETYSRNSITTLCTTGLEVMSKVSRCTQLASLSMHEVKEAFVGPGSESVSGLSTPMLQEMNRAIDKTKRWTQGEGSRLPVIWAKPDLHRRNMIAHAQLCLSYHQ